MKRIFNLLKKIIVSALLLYTYNLICSPFNLVIPINYVTIFIVTFLDLPGIALLMVILNFFY